MYYTMYCLDPDDAPLARIEYDFSQENDPFRSWLSGEPFDVAPLVPVKLVRGSRGVLPEMLQVPIPIISGRLGAVLQDLEGTNLETFPVEIHNAQGQLVATDYVAFNVVGLLRASDLVEGSDLKLARLDGSENILLVHGSVKEAILEAGIATLTFLELSEIAII